MSVSLAKGSSLSLVKADGSALSKVRLGLGWDVAAKPAKGLGRLFGGGGGGNVDLDASAILFDASGRERGIVYYGSLKSKCRSVVHSGDNLTGEGEGDDEQIVVDLNAVPADIAAIVFTINSYSGQTFDQLENVFARVVDLSSGSESEVVRYNLAESKDNTANVIAKISRDGAGWKFSAIGEFTNGKTAHKVVDTAKRFL